MHNNGARMDTATDKLSEGLNSKSKITYLKIIMKQRIKWIVTRLNIDGKRVDRTEEK